MPWKCRMVEHAGQRHEVIYMSDTVQDRRPCVIHSRRYDIPTEDYASSNKWERYTTTEPMVCDHCHELFTPQSTSFGSFPVWNTIDGKLHIGDMYYSTMDEEHFPSLEYKRDHLGKRKSLFVATPGGIWGMDQPASNGHNGSGWTVTGEAPNVTAQPSIAMSKYHGWLKNGELTDDLEGRRYPAYPEDVIKH